MSSVFPSIIHNYFCADYLCCTKTKVYVENKVFENTTYNDISTIDIPELSMYIMSRHGFLNDMKSAAILSFCSKLVDYYPSKGFLFFKTNQVP